MKKSAAMYSAKMIGVVSITLCISFLQNSARAIFAAGPGDSSIDLKQRKIFPKDIGSLNETCAQQFMTNWWEKVFKTSPGLPVRNYPKQGQYDWIEGDEIPFSNGNHTFVFWTPTQSAVWRRERGTFLSVIEIVDPYQTRGYETGGDLLQIAFNSADGTAGPKFQLFSADTNSSFTHLDFFKIFSGKMGNKNISDILYTPNEPIKIPRLRYQVDYDLQLDPDTGVEIGRSGNLVVTALTLEHGQNANTKLVFSNRDDSGRVSQLPEMLDFTPLRDCLEKGVESLKSEILFYYSDAEVKIKMDEKFADYLSQADAKLKTRLVEQFSNDTAWLSACALMKIDCDPTHYSYAQIDSIFRSIMATGPQMSDRELVQMIHDYNAMVGAIKQETARNELQAYINLVKLGERLRKDVLHHEENLERLRELQIELDKYEIRLQDTKEIKNPLNREWDIYPSSKELPNNLKPGTDETYEINYENDVQK